MMSKIKYYLFFAFFVFTFSANAQSGAVNYILERTLLEKETDETKVFETPGLQSISYFDGLGRPIQTIGVGQSPSEADIVQIIDYDDFGRETIKYMPYTQADNNGAFIPIEDAKTANSGFFKPFFGNDEIFTAETKFDSSPLNRPTEQGAPGADWQIGTGHTVKFTYATNTADIKRWTLTEPGMEAANYTEESNYDANTLYVNTVTDENQKTTKEYKNLQGQVVMTEAFNEGTALCTYYIYDDFGLLRCVVPPLANSTVDDKLCYFYQYDSRRRMTAKKIPGAEAIYMVYDSRDRLVLTQDGNMRAENKWMATVYDDFNRPKKTGIYTSSESQSDLTIALEGDMDYIKDKTLDELSQTFYDNYDGLAAEYDYADPAKEGFETSENTAIKGQITYTKTKVPETDEWLTTVNYYDDKYRVIQTIAGNHLGGRDIISNRYDFTGKVMETVQTHSANGNSQSITKTFDYDHAGRLLETKMALGTETPKTIAHNTYNELGQLQSKNTHKNTGDGYLLTTNYGYNIRGWMTQMENFDKANTSLFDLTLGYNQVDINPQYNGNISYMGWTSKTQTDPSTYNFVYDDINRLREANFNGKAGTDYSTSYRYDANGNIETLTRQGMFGDNTFGQIDNLDYAYNGNQLIQVNDLATAPQAQLTGFSDKGTQSTAVATDPATHEYLYDANGNLTVDYNKQLENIRYNHLNLPKAIDLASNNQIEYMYDAAGIKLQQKVIKEGAIEKVTDYIGNFVYENGSLKYIITDDGRLLPKESGGFEYEYTLKDHLGNTRVVVTDPDNDGLADLQQESHYYPFGMVMDGQNYTAPSLDPENKNKYLYNGKELQDDLGLDWYDYGARFYDAQIGRWHSVDPKGEKFYSLTPYNFCGNDPINHIDPDGQLFGRIRSWFGQLFSGGSRFQNDYGDWVVINRQKGRAKNYGGSGFNKTNTPLGSKVEAGNLIFEGFFNTVAEYDVSRIGHLIPKDETPQEYAYRISGHTAPAALDPADFIGGGIAALLKNSAKKVVAASLLDDATNAMTKAEMAAIKGGGTLDDLVRVRHHTSPTGLKGIKNSKSINASRGKPYGVDVEVTPFTKATNANLGQAGKGSYVEFLVPRSRLSPIPGFMGGSGNSARIVTNGAPLNISTSSPKFVRFNWLGL